ncbi:MAG: sigma 54-interacting transcriptional regulator [Planctomycetota bacterium]
MEAQNLQCIAVEAASNTELSPVLQCLVNGLSREPGVVLARVWLRRPGDICDDCYLRAECETHVDCLHLVASAGQSTVDPNVTWNGTQGRFQRFPFGARKIGEIGVTGAGIRLRTDDSSWLVHPEWVSAEQICCFAGQPLSFRGETLGAVGVFSQRPISDEDFGWLRTFADQAAVAIANARAFEELARLQSQLEIERDYLRAELHNVHAGGIVGQSAPIQTLLHQVEMVAKSDATALITGESGTGKELIATAIHENSSRSDKPLVRVNCAATPTELFESEFFGHVKGSYTGATQDRPGRFEVADGGTLFLDEVGEIPVFLQGKLLRVLQDGEYSRVGEDDVRTVDVRIIAATNRDLLEEVKAGRFREDLYYRLAVFPLHSPPLRERRDDIPLLVQHFLEKATPQRQTEVPLRKGEIERLQSYDWPGNVRELQSVIQRALITRGPGPLAFELPQAPKPTVGRSGKKKLAAEFLTENEMKQLERDNIRAALDHANWKVSGAGGAAELLGMKPTTLASRIRKLAIQRTQPSP